MKETVSDIEEVVKTVLFRNRELSKRVSELEAENAELRERLSRYEKPEKDSHNSSTPPSKESIKAQAVRRTRSLRKPSNRHTGGQEGHKGSTLLMSDTPDVTEIHTPDYCSVCGRSLSAIQGKEVETRQSIDIPLPVVPIITNHVSVEKKCTCGKCNRGTFPAHVKSGVSYGVNLHAVAGYLSTVQHIPFKRLTGTLEDLYGIKISQGSVSNILNRMRKQSNPGYEAIRQVIEKSPVVGADETGEHLNGSLHWMWTFQNELVTYIFQHPSRGKAAIDEHFPQGLPHSILVTDRHRSYFKMETAGHQICLAHLLRELIYLGELDKEQKWSSALLDLLRDSIHQKKETSLSLIDADSIKEKFNTLMNQDLSLLDKQFHALQKSLIKHSNHLFQFLEYVNVPYENNASERSIRPLKVKQKVSGGFKSDNGADAFCQLHSIVHTARKNGQNPFKALIAVAENITFDSA
jgi:transposase